MGEIHLPNSDLEFWGLLKRNMLSVLGVPPAKMQQRSFISKIKKQLLKYCGNRVTQSAYFIEARVTLQMGACFGTSARDRTGEGFGHSLVQL